MDICFKYNYALVSRIANSFDEESCYPLRPKQEIDVDKARREHEELVECLRRIGVDVIELPSDDKYPDGVYVDDIAVAINGTALICNPRPVKGAPSRAGELAVVRQVLRRELNLKTVDVTPSDKAFLEGGDVLWTGREIFVGVRSDKPGPPGRSNELGALAVAKTFPEYSTSLIQMPEGSTHLKHYVTMAGPDVMVISNSEISKLIWKEIKNTGCHGYKYITVDEDDAANVIYCNDRLIHLDSQHIPNSAGVFANKIACPRVAVSLDETLKRGRPLGSCVLLIHRVKHPKTFPTTTDINKA